MWEDSRKIVCMNFENIRQSVWILLTSILQGKSVRFNDYTPWRPYNLHQPIFAHIISIARVRRGILCAYMWRWCGVFELVWMGPYSIGKIGYCLWSILLVWCGKIRIYVAIVYGETRKIVCHWKLIQGLFPCTIVCGVLDVQVMQNSHMAMDDQVMTWWLFDLFGDADGTSYMMMACRLCRF